MNYDIRQALVLDSIWQLLVCFLVVMFHHRSVFPVRLRKDTVKQWWVTDLIFKIYSRKSDQKKVSDFWLNMAH